MDIIKGKNNKENVNEIDNEELDKYIGEDVIYIKKKQMASGMKMDYIINMIL